MTFSGRTTWRLLAVLSLLIACACRACWLPSRGIERAVTVTELAGVWTLTPESLALLEREGYESAEDERHFVTLLPSGTSAVATAWDGFDAPVRLDFRAEWTIRDVEEPPVIYIESEEHTVHLTVDEDDDGLVLFTFLGDPDSWEFLELRRED